MGTMSVGNLGQLIGGLSTAVGTGTSIMSGIQAKEAAEQAARLQGRALDQSMSLGSQSTALGLAQLDLQRQLASRGIDLANQWLSTTEPFRNQILSSGPLTVAGAGGVGPINWPGLPAQTLGMPQTAGGSEVVQPSGPRPVNNLILPEGITNQTFTSIPSDRLPTNLAASSAAPAQAAGPDPPRRNFDGSWEVPGLPGTWPTREAAIAATGARSEAAPAASGNSGLISLPYRTFTPTAFSMTPAERDTLEAQFRNARESTLASSPVRGGAMGRNLLDLEMGRANAVVGLESALARRNQELTNAAALTNFQAALDTDRFNATDAINVRNMNFQSALADRSMAAQIGFGAPGVALPALANAGAAFSPSAAGAVFGPALSAQQNAAGMFGQQLASANQQASSAGQGLGSLAAAGKLASSKGGRQNSNQSLSQFFGKGSGPNLVGV